MRQWCEKVWRYVLLSAVAALVAVSLSPTVLAIDNYDQQSELGSRYPAQVSGRTLAQTPRQGPPGSLFTVRARGFRSFELVESIKLGGIELLGSRTINTDGDGVFTAEDLRVPGLDPGRYALVVAVGTGDHKTTVSNIFEVTGQHRTAASVPLASGLTRLIDADNLVRVFYFQNSTKDWLYYDPRPAFADVNTLDELHDGEIYWIKVRRDQEVTLNQKAKRMSCAKVGKTSENCWNLVVW